MEHTHSDIRHQPRILDKSGAVVGEMDIEGESSRRRSYVLENREFVVIGSDQKPIAEFKPVLVALSIKWEDGIAYRTNLARIEEEGWNAAEPCSKLIVLG